MIGWKWRSTCAKFPRRLPELSTSEGEARYFNLGRTTNNRAIFSVFWTDGKRYRVILARDMTAEEVTFYDRKNSEFVM